MSSELAFRAQLILREQRELYDYWRASAGGRPIPSRFDIDPIDIPHLLPGLSLLDAGPALEALRYRLAGTRVREIYGAEITGRTVFEIGSRQKDSYWRAVYRQVIEDGLPMQGAMRGPAQGRDHIVLIWLRLPLSGLSGAIERVLGYDAAIPASLTFPLAGDTGEGHNPLQPRRALR
jgi:hypothetical protein